MFFFFFLITRTSAFLQLSMIQLCFFEKAEGLQAEELKADGKTFMAVAASFVKLKLMCFFGGGRGWGGGFFLDVLWSFVVFASCHGFSGFGAFRPGTFGPQKMFGFLF